MSSPIYQAIKQISEEKNIPMEAVLETVEAALASAYAKDFGDKKTQNIKVKFDPETGEFEVFDVKTVVEDQELPPEEPEVEEPKPAVPGLGGKPMPRPLAKPVEETPAEPQLDAEGNPLPEEKKFNPKTEIMISAAKKLKKSYKIGDEIVTELDVPAAFGRMAAQTAKQVIMQRLREAERNRVFTEFKEREHQLVNATVQRREGPVVLIDLGRISAVMPPDEQIPAERYIPGERIKVFVTDVRLTTRGPEVIVSRAHPEIVKKLFGMEIPEVAAGVVNIHAVAREAGSRSKVAVSSSQENVDPIGSCIGQRGSRIQTVIAELGGEKVDIIQFDTDAVKFISNALSPAKVSSIELHEDSRTADVLVEEDQLSLAIGKGGQNVRLASKLTGWRINIREINEPAAAKEAPKEEAATEEVSEAVPAAAEEPAAEAGKEGEDAA